MRDRCIREGVSLVNACCVGQSVSVAASFKCSSVGVLEDV